MTERMWHEQWQEDKGVNNDNKYQLQVLPPTDLVTKTPSLHKEKVSLPSESRGPLPLLTADPTA